MKKLKRNEGITLIALVITIIILLILAGVAINMLAGDNGILKQAKRAKTETERTSQEEQNMLNELEKVISQELGEITIEDLKNSGAKATRKTVITDENGDKITIPVGFRIALDSAIQIKNGVVIEDDDENQFVWIPVKDISKMYGTLSDGTKAGKIYVFNSNGSISNGWTEENGVMNATEGEEPVLLDNYGTNEDTDTDSKYYRDILGYSSSADFKKAMQDDFDEMIKCVDANKGFYVGRYETSYKIEGDGTKKMQSKKGVESATAAEDSANTWYGLYKLQKSYSNEYVQSSMIWGCQLSQMLIWMKNNNINVTSSTPIEGAVKNTTRIAGNEQKDKLNNIYDLLGSGTEWTLTGYDTVVRMYINDGCVSDLDYRGDATPNYIGSDRVSRAILYVK